ncbi:MAG: hypothetical protein IK115_02380 [Lachnospiraceae bacterium]|nr:hypothetical protein [Lachnospiraceae bacterium]
MEEKKTILLAEYQGRCDEMGTAVGHAPKVLGEYAGLLKNGFKLRVLAPRCVLQAADRDAVKGAKVLPHNIVMKAKPGLLEKIFNKLRMFANIRLVLRQKDVDWVWFFNTEFYLCLYLFLFGNSGKRIAASFFKENYDTGRFAAIKRYIFAKAQENMSIILSAGEDFRFEGADSVFFPDYYCDEEEYAPYRIHERQRRAVCLGTMGAEKELEEMVETFTRLGIPLTVAGRFYDKERLKKLREAAGENIQIRDEYLSREEYLRLLGSAAYVVLPYAPDQYNTQTSGVLQEALFLDTVPVSYGAVLSGNRVPGVGFADWKSLKKEELPEDTGAYRREYARLRAEKYSKEVMRDKLEKVFEGQLRRDG